MNSLRSLPMAERLLAAARSLFLERGYSNTSMDTIAKFATVSKATLYSHFQNKEALFSAVIDGSLQHLQEALQAVPAPNCGCVKSVLQDVGAQFLRQITAKDYIDLYRVVIGESRQFPEISKRLSKTGSSSFLGEIIGLIDQFVARGELAISDTSWAARQFLALLRTDVQFRCVLDPEMVVTEMEITELAEEAVELFLSHYQRTRAGGLRIDSIGDEMRAGASIVG